MPNKPAVTVKQEQQIQEDVAVEEAELSSCLVGPIYEVLEKEKASSTFDPTGADQTFAWPSLRANTQIDLEAVLNGRVDQQLEEIAVFPPKFYLEDDRGEHPELSRDEVGSIDQSNFDILQNASNGLERTTLDAYQIQVNNERYYRKDPTGVAMNEAEIDDKFTVTSGGTDYTMTVKSLSTRELRVDSQGNLPPLSNITHELEGEKAGSNDEVDTQTATTAGRINVVGAAGSVARRFET